MRNIVPKQNKQEKPILIVTLHPDTIKAFAALSHAGVNFSLVASGKEGDVSDPPSLLDIDSKKKKFAKIYKGLQEIQRYVQLHCST